ncbi:MAG: polyamine aminopropyltransferase [Nostoc sp.]|uniref:polyamine aminopropyltransferase n=1 Tax=Nostoc sp. TaxID=1180 RepID=UPI002FFCA41C
MNSNFDKLVRPNPGSTRTHPVINEPMKALGRHIIAELYGCAELRLSDVEYIEENMINAARRAGATLVNSTFHQFQPFGVSGVVVIQESHLSIHIWPEYRFASLDLFTCSETIDPWIAYQILKEALQAEHGSATEMWRGSLDLLHKYAKNSSEQQEQTDFPVIPKFNRNVWFTEWSENTAFSLKHTGNVLYRKTSPYQDIKIYKTSEFGNALVLDGCMMCTEKDEYIYHEMIAHVPMLTHPNPKRALIIGGGDGGTARELLKHESLEEVIMVEIDQDVIEASKLHLPTISEALDHPKLTITIADGIEYVRECDRAFDLIIVDSTDPIGPAEGLFNLAFYQDAHRCLTEYGILVVQSESPLLNSNLFQEIFSCHQQIFGSENVHCYLASIPTYPSGLWSFSYAAKGNIHPLKNFNREKAQSFAKMHSLNYYNAEIHLAAFALPTFVQKLLNLES